MEQTDIMLREVSQNLSLIVEFKDIQQTSNKWRKGNRTIDRVPVKN